MPDDDTSIGMIRGRRQATRRIADGMLRVLGGDKITLRLADASTGDTDSQLGITSPTASDIEIAPAVVQVEATPSGAQRVQVILGNKTLQPIVDSYGVTDIPGWFIHSQGLVYRGSLFPITSVLSQQFAGGEYLYLLTATE